jgi:Fe-S cluster biosynthesis and repair protein YggX
MKKDSDHAIEMIAAKVWSNYDQDGNNLLNEQEVSVILEHWREAAHREMPKYFDFVAQTALEHHTDQINSVTSLNDQQKEDAL